MGKHNHLDPFKIRRMRGDESIGETAVADEETTEDSVATGDKTTWKTA